MYKIKDYINRGARMVNNNLLPSNKKLSTIMLYATDRCNSKCKHCYIWDKNPKQHLSFEIIKGIVESPAVTQDTVIGLEGGEFLLHPEFDEIMDYMSKNHKKYDLLSNGVLADKLIESVRKYKPLRLFLSLDGTKETYKYMRGVDNYDNVVKVIKELKGELPISAMFTLTQFNTFEDLKHVAHLCKENEIDMRIGIYNTMEYFDTKGGEESTNSLNYSLKDIPDEVSMFAENYDFFALYPEYRNGNLKLSCNSIKDSIVIYPNGDIPICQNKQLILGNLNNEPLHKIINKPETIKLHKEHKHNCNGCWINFHRKYDIVLYRNLERIFPKSLIKSLVGDYNWNEDPKTKYKDIVTKA